MAFKKVLPYGDSILMAGLVGSLQAMQGVDVLHPEGRLRPSVEQLVRLAPDLIIFDLRDPESLYALPVWCSLAGVTLVGLDAVTGTLSLLRAESRLAGCIQDVLDLLKEIT